MDPNTPLTPAPAGVPTGAQPPIEQQPWTPPPGGQSPSKKKWLVIAAAVVVALLLIGGGLLWWSAKQKSAYAAATVAYEARAKDAYKYFNDLTNRIEHGKDIEKEFDAAIATAPIPKSLLGMKLANSADERRTAELTKALKDFEDAYVLAAEVSDYSAAVLPILDSTSKALFSARDFDSLKPHLVTGKEKIQALIAPAPLKEFDNTMVKAYTDAIIDIDTAAKALEDNDSATFNTNVSKLFKDTKVISALSAVKDLERIYDEQYSKADTAYTALQKQLGVSE
jgi:hypothetical protein